MILRFLRCDEPEDESDAFWLQPGDPTLLAEGGKQPRVSPAWNPIWARGLSSAAEVTK